MNILLTGSSLFNLEKVKIGAALTEQGHVVYNAGKIYRSKGKGEKGDQAVENLMRIVIDAMLICTDDTGYVGTITTIRVGMAKVLGIPIYTNKPLRDNDFNNYINAVADRDFSNFLKIPKS